MTFTTDVWSCWGSLTVAMHNHVTCLRKYKQTERTVKRVQDNPFPVRKIKLKATLTNMHVQIVVIDVKTIVIELVQNSL